MTALPTGRAGQVAAVGLLAIVAVLAWLVVAAPLMAWHSNRAEALAGRTALARRMAQLAERLPELQRQAAASAAAGPAANALIEGSSDAVAGAALQQAVQGMASRAGATLSSTEALVAEPAGAYRRISLRVAVNAPWPLLVEMLRQTAEATPQMLVDDLQVRGNRAIGVQGVPPLDASWTVMGFRAGPTP